MVETYDLNLKKSSDVNARIYKIYEDSQLLLTSTNFEDVSRLKMMKNKNLKVVVEPEVIGVRMIIVLFLQIISTGIDQNFFKSFLQDSIEIKRYSLDTLTLNYTYSFESSFSLDKSFSHNQQKVIASRNLWTVVIMLLFPLTLLNMYCIIMLILGENYWMIRLIFVSFFCALQVYLSWQMYKLSRFRKPKRWYFQG